MKIIPNSTIKVALAELLTLSAVKTDNPKTNFIKEIDEIINFKGFYR